MFNCILGTAFKVTYHCIFHLTDYFIGGLGSFRPSRPIFHDWIGHTLSQVSSMCSPCKCPNKAIKNAIKNITTKNTKKTLITLWNLENHLFFALPKIIFWIPRFHFSMTPVKMKRLEPKNPPNRQRKIIWSKPPWLWFQMLIFQGVQTFFRQNLTSKPASSAPHVADASASKSNDAWPVTKIANNPAVKRKGDWFISTNSSLAWVCQRHKTQISNFLGFWDSVSWPCLSPLLHNLVKVKFGFLSQKWIDCFPTVNQGFGNPQVIWVLLHVAEICERKFS